MPFAFVTDFLMVWMMFPQSAAGKTGRKAKVERQGRRDGWHLVTVSPAKAGANLRGSGWRDLDPPNSSRSQQACICGGRLGRCLQND